MEEQHVAEITPHPQTRPGAARPGLIFLATLIAFWVAWCAANWPAMKSAWWYMDDFAGAEALYDSMRQGLSNGRPVSGLWFYTFALDGGKDRQMANRLLRAGQGALHALAGALAVIVLSRQATPLVAVAGVLPFVLWPFNGEVTLWRAAGHYPLAACLSLLGLFFIQHNRPRLRFLSRPLGAGLIFLAALTNQVGACAALVVSVIGLSSGALRNVGLQLRQSGRDFAWMLPGYLAGALVSFSIARVYGPWRAHLAMSVRAKEEFLLQLNHNFLLSDLYPEALKIFQLAMLIVPLALLVGRAVSGRRSSVGGAVIAAGGLTGSVILPYLPAMVVAENWPSWRVMYLAPFAFGAAWLVGERSVRAWPKVRTLLGIALLVILGFYVSVSWENSSEYVLLFEYDLNTLRRLEGFASEVGIQRVFVVTEPSMVGDGNPYRLRYWYADAHQSALFIRWSAHPFIRRFSSLAPVDGDPRVRQRAVQQCESAPGRGQFRFYAFDELKVICVCPP